MAFVLENPTDDQREAMGFARTLDDVKLPNRKRCSFVSKWAIDREREVYFIPTGLSGYEIHWKNNVISIDAPREETLELTPDDSNIAQRFNHAYTIRQLIIPRALEGKENVLSTIKALADEVFKFYWHGKLKYKGNITVTFSPDLEVRYQEHVKSRVKLSDFATIQ